MTEMRPFLIDKPAGATPLEALEMLRSKLGLPAAMRLSYAGRLDPMASGLLLVLHGNLLKEQEKFWGLEKTYLADIALGVGTDSYDLLGLAEAALLPVRDSAAVLSVLGSLVGKLVLPVPAYSSYRHKGKPLFAWARENKLEALPLRSMTVSEIEVRSIIEKTLSDLAEMAIERCKSVRGDFRQEVISERWRFLAEMDGLAPVIMTGVTIHCASGTYVRSLANEAGRRLKTRGLLAGLRRLSVGPFSLDDPELVRLSWPQ